jgi:pimeloyl-ACP methyl ester carboxylesterase
MGQPARDRLKTDCSSAPLHQLPKRPPPWTASTLQSRIPTLIIWGREDRIIPLVHAYKAHEAIPNSRLEVIEGVGHYPHVEDPYGSVEILCDFRDDPAEQTRPRRVSLRLEHGSLS